MDFEHWLDGIVGTCELIANKDVFWKVWVEKDYSITSIHYYNELYEQLVGDLNLDVLITEFSPRFGEQSVIVLQQFSKAVHVLDIEVESTERLRDAETLLTSLEWGRLKAMATHVLSLPETKKYLNDGKTREILTRLQAANF